MLLWQGGLEGFPLPPSVVKFMITMQKNNSDRLGKWIIVNCEEPHIDRGGVGGGCGVNECVEVLHYQKVSNEYRTAGEV
jgi:hypothetical protein